MKSITKKRTIRAVILFLAITFVLVCMIFPSVVYYEHSVDYKFIERGCEDAQSKGKILFSAQNYEDTLLSTISQMEKANTYSISECCIKYLDREVLKPQYIDVMTDDDSKIILITYYTNEARQKAADVLPDALKLHFFNQSYLTEKEWAGILYCSDEKILSKYSDIYTCNVYGARFGTFMVTPLSGNGNIYYFDATHFAGAEYLDPRIEHEFSVEHYE